MEIPKVDESKLQEVMELIEKADSIMAEIASTGDTVLKQKLDALQERLRSVTGNKNLNVTDFQRYWEATDLKTVAKTALRLPPEKCDVTDDQIKEIVINILKNDEADMDYWFKFLKVNTGLTDITDYIFYPNLKGMEQDATLEQIADRIIADKNNESKIIYL